MSAVSAISPCLDLMRTPQLVGVLMRSRQGEIALTADIEKASLQLELQEPDRDACRFFWLRNQKLKGIFKHIGFAVFHLEWCEQHIFPDIICAVDCGGGWLFQQWMLAKKLVDPENDGVMINRKVVADDRQSGPQQQQDATKPPSNEGTGDAA
ncbi:unnamed protein product [Toxocara canis]|uniref:Bacteriophage protein n=1 Tax=Toxocara canis TaxID=6265 RepID=A0A183TWD9_TOXCA|nr:unnamed protein product [Toxocara canis]